MNWGIIHQPWSAEAAGRVAEWFWMLLGAVWLVKSFRTKKSKKHESLGEFAQHGVFALLGFWLIFEKSWVWAPWERKLFPNVSLVWNVGLLFTAAGVGVAIWARLSLGGNWSGAVSVKDQHELVGSGLYRRVRHPIYTGILWAACGTTMIKGHLRAWIGAVILLAMFYFKARREERFLRQEFGAGFEEHVRRTGMFLPKRT